jgi:hypothetical protein
MNSGRRDEFASRMRPGDTVTQRRRLVGWRERATRLGPTIFVTLELLLVNQDGVTIRTREQSMLRYFADAAIGK